MEEVTTILKFIGLKRSKPGNLQSIAEQGLSKKSVLRLIKNSRLPADYILRYVGIRLQALNMKLDNEKISIPASDRVLDLAQLYVHGINAFDTVGKFNLWLATSIPVLEGRKPIDLIQSRWLKVVEEMLLRIEYGMFA
ncbi:MAG TPA: antitoxin Xre/MbcA/ParS toxin-binding domain-containing protein [Cyclobacteriaceae bacterium]|jgi:putative toxin-antitoxin system antitoxin component (TIGR02293 family)|nr:antitoxin Xre/MbcA/ParS toxin-binding domain-containing protein [Cyclobacteriaceae bacterium]